MQKNYLILVPSLYLLLRTIVIELGKNNRFKRFPKIYPNEGFDKLIEYEEKAKVEFYLRKNEN